MHWRARRWDFHETLVGALARDGVVIVEGATVRTRLEGVRASFRAAVGLVKHGDELEFAAPGRTIRLVVDRPHLTWGEATFEVVDARVVLDLQDP